MFNCRKYHSDPMESKRSKQKLLQAAETAKKVLSTLQTANVHVESLHEGIDFNCSVTRARTENEMGKMLPKFVEPAKKLLSETNLEIDHLTLIGGSCKVPKLRQMLKDLLPKATMAVASNTDELLALGAAQQCSLSADCRNLNGKTEIQGGKFR